MKLMCVAIRLVLFGVTTAALYLLWLAGRLLLFLFQAPVRRWRNLIFRAMGKTTARIIGMRITVQGEPPEPPFFLVANHLSYVDIVLFAAALDCVFVSRHDLAHWPWLGLLARSLGTIFLNRERRNDIPRVIAEINRTLDAGQGVVLFPEGTSTKGDLVQLFKPSLLEPAAAAGYPVSYATIAYRTPPDEPPAHMAVCWWGDMTFLPHLVELMKLRRFDAFLTFGPDAIRASDRRELADQLWRAVNEQFVPMVEPQQLNNGK